MDHAKWLDSGADDESNCPIATRKRKGAAWTGKLFHVDSAGGADFAPAAPNCAEFDAEFPNAVFTAAAAATADSVYSVSHDGS